MLHSSAKCVSLKVRVTKCEIKSKNGLIESSFFNVKINVVKNVFLGNRAYDTTTIWRTDRSEILGRNLCGANIPKSFPQYFGKWTMSWAKKKRGRAFLRNHGSRPWLSVDNLAPSRSSDRNQVLMAFAYRQRRVSITIDKKWHYTGRRRADKSMNYAAGRASRENKWIGRRAISSKPRKKRQPGDVRNACANARTYTLFVFLFATEVFVVARLKRQQGRLPFRELVIDENSDDNPIRPLREVPSSVAKLANCLAKKCKW